MTKCPDKETLLSFACNPLHQEKVSIATHILDCSQCRSILKRYNDLVVLDDADSDDDTSCINSFLRMKNSTRCLWQNLKNHLESSNIFSGETLPFLDFLTPSPNFLMSFGDRENGSVFRNKSFEDSTVELEFSSLCDEFDNRFWRALLLIPIGIQASDSIDIKVYDKDDMPIPDAVLSLMGVKLHVRDGLAQITLKGLQDNIRNPFVSLERKIDGETIGTLRFF